MDCVSDLLTSCNNFGQAMLQTQPALGRTQELQTKAEQALHQALYEHEESVERLQHTSAYIQDFHRRVMEVLQSRMLAHTAAPASVLASMTTGTTLEPATAAASPGPNTPASGSMR